MPGWRLEKTPRAGAARGIQFLLSASSLPSRPLHPPSLRACRATGRVNRQPNLDVSSRPRLPVGFSSGPRSCLHLYRITRTRLWSGSCVEGPDPLCSPLLHSFTVMAQVRSKVTGAGKVVSLFVSKMKLVRNRK